MEYNIVFFLILFFVVVEFCMQQMLSFLNRRAASPVLPDKLIDLYDKTKYAEQQQYFSVNNKLGSISSIVDFVVIILFLVFGWFGGLYDWAYQVTSGSLIWNTLLFFGLLFMGNTLLSLPFDIYDTFVIEERFGFNKTTPFLFVADQLKSLFFGLFIGGLLLTVILFLYQWLGSLFWLAGCAVVVLFMILLNMFYSQWIVPLFNKQTPLPEGELRSAIERFADHAGFCLDNIYVIDGSKRSTKANAYFSGLGSKKRIVLFDTLIDELTTEEIVAVLAHETGHYKHKHTLQMLLLSVVNVFLIFFLFSWTVGNVAFAEALGGKGSSFALSLVAFSLLYSPLGLITGLFINALSRKNEYQADAFAAKYNLTEALISGLKKISVRSLSNLTPHPLYVKVYYSHPTLLQRIGRLMNKA
ncbi:M48 family metallopeptidase [Coprobacter tertius]|uniref:M48 family metallopeptidase n=1 Tax=Coprobacter tertius TaxID=2944915 RepID=A0ABT1MF19_9BACT|nr:M48 family metallopeptidase [Coprobacter tertius]MCP9611224.1 M48 family metallopeptidase [Coprobacter tertius]